jgi:hypothetical protein
MTALPPDIRSRVVGARPPKKCLGLVLREDLGSEPSDASITRSGHQGSHQFARHAAMLPFVGHEDRDLSGGGSVSSRAYRATATMPRSSTAITAGRRMIDVTCSSPEALRPRSIAALD